MKIKFTKHAAVEMYNRCHYKVSQDIVETNDYVYDGPIDYSQDRTKTLNLYIYTAKVGPDHAILLDDDNNVVTTLLRNSNRYFKVIDDHYSTKRVRDAYKRYEKKKKD